MDLMPEELKLGLGVLTEEEYRKWRVYSARRQELIGIRRFPVKQVLLRQFMREVICDFRRKEFALEKVDLAWMYIVENIQHRLEEKEFHAVMSGIELLIERVLTERFSKL